MAKKLKLNLRDPNTLAVLVIVLLFLGGGYMWYNDFYSPTKEEIDAKTEEKKRLDSELARINALKPQLENLRREAALLEAQLDSLKNIFPDRAQVPRLIRDMTAVNRRSNVAVTRFTPKPDVVREYYIENKYDVAVSGDYHNLGALFSYFANFQLIVNLSNVTISANPAFTASEVGRMPSIHAAFELTTFSSKQ